MNLPDRLAFNILLISKNITENHRKALDGVFEIFGFCNGG